MSPEARPNSATSDQVLTRAAGENFRQLAARYRVTEAMVRDFIAFIPVGAFATNDEIIDHLFPNGGHKNKPSKLKATANLLLVNTAITSRKRKVGSEYHHVKLTDLPALQRKWEEERKLQQTKMPLIEGRVDEYLAFLPLGAQATSVEITTHFHPGRQKGFGMEASRYKRAANKVLADQGEMVVEHNSTYYHIRTEELPALQNEWEQERRQKEREASARRPYKPRPRSHRVREEQANKPAPALSEAKFYFLACFAKTVQNLIYERTEYIPTDAMRQTWDDTMEKNRSFTHDTDPLSEIKETAELLNGMSTYQYFQFRQQNLDCLEIFEYGGKRAGQNIMDLLKEFKQHSLA